MLRIISYATAHGWLFVVLAGALWLGIAILVHPKLTEDEIQAIKAKNEAEAARPNRGWLD